MCLVKKGVHRNMNKIFKVVWSKSKECYVVVSEVAKNNGGKKKALASVLAGLAIMGAAAQMGTPVQAGADNRGSAVNLWADKQLDGTTPNTANTVGANSVAIGNNLVAGSASTTPTGRLGGTAIAIGVDSQAKDDRDIAIGYNNTTEGQDSVAMGSNVIAGTGQSIAIGSTNTAPDGTQTQTIARGKVTMKNGRPEPAAAIAIGVGAQALDGSGVLAMGQLSYAKGNNDVAIGTQTKVIGNNSTAIGSTAQAIGNSSAAFGTQAVANGLGATAVGPGASAGTGDTTATAAAGATAVGRAAQATKEGASALGWAANASVENAAAIGRDTTANIAGGVALGYQSVTTTAAGVQGYNPASDRTDKYSTQAGAVGTSTLAAVSIGEGVTKTRQLTGLAAGTEDTDAVNVAQLKNVNLKYAGDTGNSDVLLKDHTLNINGDTDTFISTSADANGVKITAKVAKNITANADGKAVAPTTNGIATTDNVTQAINNSGWKVTSANNGGTTNGSSSEKVSPGDTVTFSAGKNIVLDQAGKQFTYSLSSTLKDIESIQNGASKITLNNGGGTTISGGNLSVDGNKITNVAPGTISSTSTDAVNGSQLYDVDQKFNNTVKLTGNAGATDGQALNKANGLSFGVIGANSGAYIKTSATGSDVTVDLSDDAKTKLNKTYTVSSGSSNVTVTPTTVGDNTDYKISVTGGAAASTWNIASDKVSATEGTVAAGSGAAQNIADTKTVTMQAGKNLTVNQTNDGNGNASVAFALDKDLKDLTSVTTDKVTTKEIGLQDTAGNTTTIKKDGDRITYTNDGGTTVNKVANLADEKHITKGEYDVDADGKVTMTYTDGNGTVVTGETAVIKGIAKQDLSNINNAGKNVITGLGTIVKAGDNVTVSEASDATTGQKTYTVNAVTPAVYTKADGTKVVKRPDGTYTTNVDGSAGNDVPASDVIVSFQDAAGNTTGGNSIVNNVGSAIDKTGTSTGDTFLTKLDTAATDTPNAAVNVKDLKNTSDAIIGKGLKFDANDGGEKTNKLGSKVTVKGEGTKANTEYSGTNIKTIIAQTGDDTTIDVKLAKDLTGINSISNTAAGPKMEFGGNSINITGGNLDLGSNKITNLGPATSGSDAVNYDQLKNSRTVVTSTDGSVTVTPTTSGDKTTYDLKVATTGTVAKSTWNIASDKVSATEGTVAAGSGAAQNIADTKTVTMQAGKNLTVNQTNDGNGNASVAFALDKDLKDLTSVTTDKVTTKEIGLQDTAGNTTTIKKDGDRITYTNDGGTTVNKVANLADEKHITKGEYDVDADGKVTMTYTDGNGTVVTGETAVIKGIAKQDLSNINNAGKNVITGLGTIVKAGDNVTVSEASDATTGQKTYTVNAVTPAVYTKADGTKVVKRPDGTYTTNVDGSAGNDVPASDVIVSFQDAAGNTTGGNSIVNNVGSAIDKTGTSTGDTFLTKLDTAATDTPNAAVNVKDLKNTSDAIIGKGLKFDANDGGEKTNKLGSKVTVKGEGTKANTEYSGTNIKTIIAQTGDDTTIDVKLAKDLTGINSISNTAAGPKMEFGGNSINITGGNLDLGGSKITNLGPATNGTDAVNYDQLKSAKTVVKAGSNVTVNKTTGANGEDVYTVNATGGTGGAASTWNLNTGVASATEGTHSGDTTQNIADTKSVTLQAGKNLTVKQTNDGNGNTDVAYSLDSDLKDLTSVTTEKVTTKEIGLKDAAGNTTTIKKDGDRITYTNDGGTTNKTVATLDDEMHIKDTTYTVDGNKKVTLTYVDGNGTDVAGKKAIIDLFGLPVGDKDTDMRIKDGNYTATNGSVTLNTVDKDGNTVAGKDVVIKGINTNNYVAGDNVTFTNNGNDANGNPIVKINAEVSTEQVVAKAGNDNLATVAPATGSTQGGKNATYEVNVDKTNLENKAEISYKANGGTAQKTTLAKGFNFTSDDNSVAITTGADGKVNFKVDTSNVQGKAFNLDVNKEGTGKVENAQTAAATPSVEKGTKFVAGNNLSIRHDGINGDANYDHQVTYALNSDLKGITSITNNGGATMNFGPNEVSITGGHLNMGGNKITNVKNGTDKSDVATVGQLTKVTSNDNTVAINKTTDADGAPVYDLSVQGGGHDPRVDELGEEVGRVGAQGAALAALKPIQYDPLEPTQIMAGYGNYRGNSAVALGVAHYKNESTLIHGGVSWAGGSSHMMANAGVTWKVGNRDSEAAVADRYRKGPISSAYAMQQEMASVKAQNAGLKTEVSDLKAENEQMKAQIAAMMAKLGM